MNADSHKKEDPLAKLCVADPDLAKKVTAVLDQKNSPVPELILSMLVEETLWSLSQEISFGQSVAAGYLDLIGETSLSKIKQYRNLVRAFGKKGPTIGKIMATYLVPVLKHDDKMIVDRFLSVVDIMLSKGPYTLNSPFKLLPFLFGEEDPTCGLSYLDLLGETFSKNLSYVQCQHFSYTLPQAVSSFSSERRVRQIEQLRFVIKTDFRLADPFLDGMQKGLHLLSNNALSRFVSTGLDKLKQGRKLAAKFLSLESKLGMDTFADFQVTVPISQVQHQLNRYLRARTGMAISVRPISSLSKFCIEAKGVEPVVCSDGKFIYLPSEIGMFSNKAENLKLYKTLVKLEAGHYEFHTFDFDLEKAMDRCKGMTEGRMKHVGLKECSDMEHFFSFFPIKALAADLFTIFEHGRIRVMLNKQYPGLIKKTLPVLQGEAERMIKKEKRVGPVFLLYLIISLDLSVEKKWGITPHIQAQVKKITDLFEKKMVEDHAVETCAEMVSFTYPKVAEIVSSTKDTEPGDDRYLPLATPFGRKLMPDFFFSTHYSYENLARKLKARLGEQGFKIYKSDIKRCLIENNGIVSHQNLKDIIQCTRENSRYHHMQQHQIPIDLSWLDLSELFDTDGVYQLQSEEFSGPVFWYREWDCNLQDYLQTHVRVLDKTITGIENDFYQRALKTHGGLVKRIRRAFELLKPEGLVRLRQWNEGEEFDYRAMLDFMVDKKAGKIPSDRLYIKHIKQTRDVSVLLLVDLSRSTANIVFDSQATVLDVEKEAIILFCKALEVVGDAFAIAGFSGTGRLGVDYMRIKDFDEIMNDTVKQRINALTPHRSTRMGAAIRHATSLLEKVSTKVRMLIILSDGFPNDVDYKREYAIEDTRKAIVEARSKNLFVHGITINFAAGSKLDDLYGNVHHNIISDVRELPDKLLSIYGRLTRN
jgi:hypothetical protein